MSTKFEPGLNGPVDLFAVACPLHSISFKRHPSSGTNALLKGYFVGPDGKQVSGTFSITISTSDYSFTKWAVDNDFIFDPELHIGFEGKLINSAIVVGRSGLLDSPFVDAALSLSDANPELQPAGFIQFGRCA